MSYTAYRYLHILMQSNLFSRFWLFFLALQPIGYGCTPVRLYASAPLHVYACLPVNLYGSTPVRLYASTPVRFYRFTPIWVYACSPLRFYACMPIRLYDFTALLLLLFFYCIVNFCFRVLCITFYTPVPLCTFKPLTLWYFTVNYYFWVVVHTHITYISHTNAGEKMYIFISEAVFGHRFKY